MSGGGGGGGGGSINAVFYADEYQPIQAGSIDGTDVVPHDNAIYRALLCSKAGLYDPFGDPKVIGDPYCTLFVGRLSRLTTEDTLRKAMSKYGRVKNLRLVRHIVTGASRGYGFVEYETEREMRRAYEDAHHSLIDDSEVIVDYNRQRLMPGWIPRRLGGGLGGKKESGQLRFGGRERPFRAPLRPIPYEDLKRLGIPPPPEGKYMSRFQVPSPPRRKRSSMDREDHSLDRDHHPCERNRHSKRSHQTESLSSRDRLSDDRISIEREEHSYKRHRHSKRSQHGKRLISQDRFSEERSSIGRVERSHKSHKSSKHSPGHDRWSPSRDQLSD